ncbi:MAG: hypothetical protein J6T74_03940 [Clostridia bacterium]|nr:hypothetical protein [Clostridia bacterium]
MKKWYITGIIGVALVIVSSVALYKNYNYKYTQKDIDKIMNILLEKTRPTKKDYKLYDLDKTGEFTLYDLVLVCKEAK